MSLRDHCRIWMALRDQIYNCSTHTWLVGIEWLPEIIVGIEWLRKWNEWLSVWFSLYLLFIVLSIISKSCLPLVFPTRKKKRKCYTNEDADAELRNDHQQKRRKISNTIAPTILVLTITLVGVCSHFMSILMEAEKRSERQSAIAKNRMPRLWTTWKKKWTAFQTVCFTDYLECTSHVSSAFAEK